VSVVRVGILQFGATKDKERNFSKIKSLIKSPDADIIVMPEYCMYDVAQATPAEVAAVAEPLSGPFTSNLIRLAGEYSAYVIAGVLESSTNGVYNTAVLISPKGELIGTYRKTHLFDAYSFRESSYFKQGQSPSEVYDLGKVKVAVAICFDIRFPEQFRIYALKGAELIAIPSAWFRGPLKEETLAFLARARAHENTVYLALSVQYSKDFTGRSMVIDPLGVVIADLGIGEKYAEVPIDLDYISEARKILPVLKLRREDIYDLKWTT